MGKAKIARTVALLFAALATLMAIRRTFNPCALPSVPCARS
ncbi:MAG TPA: hypothetical protein PLH28_08895 [Syntrophales bacterium]|jgi:hypothetical protein|nr:hypothetical protein [Syntrophales bacterium]HOT49179.1 hypothetical protein [Syntrophales bacterium]HPV54547.1 hypothetical protein [Syntrophales bacterium]